MKCSIPRCNEERMWIRGPGPSKWHYYNNEKVHERRRQPNGKLKNCHIPSMNGVPLNPSHQTNLCYYHWKKENLYYGYEDKKTKRWVESPYIGKESNPTVIARSGKTRVLGEGWEDPVSVSTRRRPLQECPVHLDT